MSRTLLLALLALLASPSQAVVIRHDVDDAQYQVPAAEFRALVDLPNEGHGVLIAPQWVITAAHTIPQHAPLKQVQIDGTPRAVERTVVHEGYRPLPQELIDQAMQSGEAMLIVAFLASMDDLALIKLTAPVIDVPPAPLYPGNVRVGQTIKLIGKGATGNGVDGYRPGGPNRTQLRRAYNTITSAYQRWFCYRFDDPASALPLEGALGNGDSGSPVLTRVDEQWQLSGLASWKVVEGNVLTAAYGVYGQVSCNVRLSHYRHWIEAVTAEPQPASR